jgi:hypothetical protein
LKIAFWSAPAFSRAGSNFSDSRFEPRWLFGAVSKNWVIYCSPVRSSTIKSKIAFDVSLKKAVSGKKSLLKGVVLLVNAAPVILPYFEQAGAAVLLAASPFNSCSDLGNPDGRLAHGYLARGSVRRWQ